VIDPKPLSGEREFSVAPIVRADELGHDRDLVIGRLDRVTAALDLDRERTRRWAFAQTLAWAFEGDKVLPSHVETASWLLESRTG
jgi:streptomycin 6-kinase